MTLARGRVLRSPDGEASPLGPTSARGTTRGSRLPSAVAEAHDEARRVVAAAEGRGRAIVEAAERRAAGVALAAEERARATALAEVAAHLLCLRRLEAGADVRALDRSVALARLLAERLVQTAIELDPGQVAGLAREALAAAGGARRIELHACPAEVDALKGALAVFDPEGRVHRIAGDADLPSGSLRLETEIGIVEVALGATLDEFAARLRGALAQ